MAGGLLRACYRMANRSVNQRYMYEKNGERECVKIRGVRVLTYDDGRGTGVFYG